MTNLYNVEKLKFEDIDECFDLRDFVFMKSYGGIFDSYTLFPAFLNNTQECADNHWIIREKGRIVACIGDVPGVMNISGEKIKVGRVTGVATHPHYSGKGYMKAIMNEVLEHYKNEGIVASYLEGLRKRYQYYGYEIAGISCEFNINEKNAKLLSQQVSEVLLFDMKKEDTQAIKFAKKLYDKELVNFERKENSFYTILTHLKNTPYIAKNINDEHVGYFVYNHEKKKVVEIIAKSVQHFESMIVSIVEKYGDIELILPPWRLDYINTLVPICERFYEKNSGNWLVNDWEPFIYALLKAKTTYMNLPDGKINIGIEDYGTLTMEVKGNEATCVKTTSIPDIKLNAFEASQLMCTPGSAIYKAKIPNELLPIVFTWFPLPLYIFTPDTA